MAITKKAAKPAEEEGLGSPRNTNDRNLSICGKNLSLSPMGEDRFFVTIPKELTEAEQEEHEATGAWPIRLGEHLPEHVPFLDFLVEQGVSEWRRFLSEAKSANDAEPAEKGGQP